MLNDLKVLLYKIIFTFNDTGALSVTNAAALFSDALVGGLWTKDCEWQLSSSAPFPLSRICLVLGSTFSTCLHVSGVRSD